MAEDCTCARCRGACNRKPGWFLPGEAEQAAALLDMTLPAFFARYLAVDYWGDGDDGGILSPAVVGGEPGREFPYDPRGRCVFYEGGRCRIHAAKPHECRAFLHDQPGDEVRARHRAVADAWTKHRARIVELLGREPYFEEPDPIERRMSRWW